MARCWIILLLATLCLAATESTTEDILQVLKNRSATIYCGRNLSDVLSLVCRGKYNTPSYRTHEHRKRDEGLNTQITEENKISLPYAATTNTDNFIPKFRRRRQPRGVYNECCQNPCSYEVLRSYCADD